jgi:sulfite reductase alpha subunit-like flavoprotein
MVYNDSHILGIDLFSVLQTSQASEHVQNYLKEREIADVLADFKSHSLPVTDLLKCMKSLQPRYYSISSSPKIVKFYDNKSVIITLIEWNLCFV